MWPQLMLWMSGVWKDAVVCAVCLVQLAVCPYTKVEESFNLQATHDLLYHGTDLQKYDHLQFPGVVPRTFVGPVAVSALSLPLVCLSDALGENKFTSQYIVRAVLGLVVCLSFSSFRRAAEAKLGPTVSAFFSLVTACQFHFLFYASRPLPNTFALVLVLLALRFWLLQQHGCFIWCSGAAIIIFRCELSLLLGFLLLQELSSGRLGLGRAVRHILPAGLVWLALTVSIDSFFWSRWLWPEGIVMWFNIIENKSHHWGTQPFWWYFYSALPRSLLLPLVFIPLGLYRDVRTRLLILPALGYVLLYSFLPHKELRFIVYAVPLFNLVAASGYAYIWVNRRKLPLFVPVGAVCSLILTFGIGLCFLHVSRHNYPGGQALRQLHSVIDRQMQDQIGNISVHIGVESAMTGVSRFGELRPDWSYSKVEGFSRGSPELLAFTFLLVPAEDLDHYRESHKLIAKAEGFSRLAVDFRKFPPVKIVLEPRVLVLMKKSGSCQKIDDS